MNDRKHSPDDFLLPETDAGTVADPAVCAHCGRPFRTGRLRDLHAGEVHAGALSADERAAYEAAVEAERDELFFFHMKVVVALGLLYSTFVIGYTALAGL